MSQDDGPVNTAVLCTRLGESSNTTGNHRARLIEAGLIESVGRGLLDVAIPGLREHLRKH